MERFADTCQAYTATVTFLSSLSPDSPFNPHLPTLFHQLRAIDIQNPDKWPDPDGSHSLVNFHKLRLSMILSVFSIPILGRDESRELLERREVERRDEEPIKLFLRAKRHMLFH